MINYITLLLIMHGSFFVLHIFMGEYKEHQRMQFTETTRHLFLINISLTQWLIDYILQFNLQ